jgi:hypothetical protein
MGRAEVCRGREYQRAVERETHNGSAAEFGVEFGDYAVARKKQER